MAVSGAAAVAYWLLLVRPRTLLSLIHTESKDEAWFEHHPAALRAARIAGGMVLVLLGMFTGVVWAFLAGLSAR